MFRKIYDEIKYLFKVATAGSKEARALEKAKKMFEEAYRENVKGKPQTDSFSFGSQPDSNHIDKYTQNQYNDFGWARQSEAISKNELDDLYSKIQEKGSLKKFAQSGYGEAIIDVNDKPHTTLGVDNVLAFVTETKNNPKITKVARFQAETETEMALIKENLYEKGSFSQSYYEVLKEFGFAREYNRESVLDYFEYKEETRRRSSGTEGGRTDRNSGLLQNGSGTFAEAQSNEIAPTKEASSTDDAFFDGNKPGVKLSLSDTLTAEQQDFFKDYVVRDRGENPAVMCLHSLIPKLYIKTPLKNDGKFTICHHFLLTYLFSSYPDQHIALTSVCKGPVRTEYQFYFLPF